MSLVVEVRDLTTELWEEYDIYRIIGPLNPILGISYSYVVQHIVMSIWGLQFF